MFQINDKKVMVGGGGGETSKKPRLDRVKHGASLYLKFEGLNLSVVIIFKTFH